MEKFMSLATRAEVNQAIKEFNKPYIVTAIDLMLSGWGHARNKRAIQVVLCSTEEQQDRVRRNLIDLKFNNVKAWCDELPKHMGRTSKYTLSYRFAEDAPLWNR